MSMDKPCDLWQYASGALGLETIYTIIPYVLMMWLLDHFQLVYYVDLKLNLFTIDTFLRLFRHYH